MYSVSVRSTCGINMVGSQAETLTSTATLFTGGSEMVPIYFTIEKEKCKAQWNGRQIIPGGNRSKSERQFCALWSGKFDLYARKVKEQTWC